MGEAEVREEGVMELLVRILHQRTRRSRREAIIEAEALLAGPLAEHDRQVRAEALLPFERLFAGGPDTPCRTTWSDGVECVEVPMGDLRAAFAHADREESGQ